MCTTCYPKDDEFPEGKELARRLGHRTILAVPLLREGDSIGAIVLRRTEVHPFSEKQIALLQTFADQAVIAIGNVRLFEEVQARTRDLTESLEQQTATSEVLQVISSSSGELAACVRILAGKCQTSVRRRVWHHSSPRRTMRFAPLHCTVRRPHTLRPDGARHFFGPPPIPVLVAYWKPRRRFK